MSQNVPITVAHGDGIGPEIMAATLQIIQAAGARLDIEEIEVGEKVYLKGISAGIDMSLKVVEHYFGEAVARATARHMEYPYPDADARRIKL